jgi:CcmD family protein
MGFLAGAMIALWLMVTSYVVYISLRQRKLEQELLTLEETLQQNPPL